MTPSEERTIAVLAYQSLDASIRSLIAIQGMLRQALDRTHDPDDPEWEPPLECLHVELMRVTTMGDEQAFCRSCGEEVDSE